LIEKERKEGERWIFELSLPEQCPLLSCLLATHNKNDPKKEAMDAWLCPTDRGFLD